MTNSTPLAVSLRWGKTPAASRTPPPPFWNQGAKLDNMEGLINPKTAGCLVHVFNCLLESISPAIAFFKLNVVYMLQL